MDEPRWLPSVTWGLDGPEAREHAAVFVLPESREALVFGGSGYAPYLDPLNDAWSFDLESQTWRPAVVRGDVPAGGGSRRVAETGDGTAYLFGGYGFRMAPNNELFRVDFSDGSLTFTRVPQENPPSPRSLHVFVYDEVAARFMLFGGVSVAPLGDLWTMRIEDGTAVWREQSQAFGPSARYGCFYGFDARHGRLLLFSGAQGTAPIDAARDTWALDVRAEPMTWTLLSEGAACPAGRRNGCTVFDPEASRLFVFGGTADGRTTQPGLFVLEAEPGREQWALLKLDGEPPLRSSGIGFYDPVAGLSCMGFGNTAREAFQDWTAFRY
jgi:hypothetical protein